MGSLQTTLKSGETLIVEDINCTRGIATIRCNENINELLLFSDMDGDLGFNYKGEEVYFSQMQRK